MNKIKLMLTAVVVLSTVGGVLAFKATRSIPICTAPTKAAGQVGAGTCGLGTPQNPFVICEDLVTGRLTNTGGLLCTQEPDDENCDFACPVLTRTTGD